MPTPVLALKDQAREAMRKADRCRFSPEDIVKTTKGNKFWGKVMNVFQISPNDWYCTVMATVPEFYGTTFVFSEKVLDFRNKTPEA